MNLSEIVIDSIKSLISPNSEIIEILTRTLSVSLLASMFSILFSLLPALYLSNTTFKGKKLFSQISRSLMSFPSVATGLLCALILCRTGPLGFANLLYTVTGMIIAQFFLLIPLSFGLLFQFFSVSSPMFYEQAINLGATKFSAYLLIAKNFVSNIIFIWLTAFSRGISEVGTVLIVGGNIKGQTRVLTTSIAQSHSMGNYSFSLTLAFWLILITLIIQFICSGSQKL